MGRPSKPLVELMHNLERRGDMYVQPFNYDTLVSYLSGYDHGGMVSGGESFLDAFRDWLHDRIGHHCALHWSVVVRDLFANRSAEQAVPVLFQLLRQFFREKKEHRMAKVTRKRKKVLAH